MSPSWGLWNFLGSSDSSRPQSPQGCRCIPAHIPTGSDSPVQMLSTRATLAAKKAKSRTFQSSWTKEFGFVFLKTGLCAIYVVRMLYAEHQVLSGILRQNTRRCSKTKQTKQSQKQASSLKVFTTVKNHGIEASYRNAHCIAKHGKPFTDGQLIKEAFLRCSGTLFKNLPNKEMIKS